MRYLVPWRKRRDGRWTKLTFLNHYRWRETGRDTAEEWLKVYSAEYPNRVVVLAVDKPFPPPPDFMSATG